jgi:lipopolysaccharide export system permease protein
MLRSINKYITKEFLKSLLFVTAVMFSITLLLTLLDEFNFFKTKQDLGIIYLVIFTFLRIPNLLFNLFPFITLFAGIVFFLKIYNYNEIISLRVMGYSNIRIILIPALTCFILGYLIIFFIVPFSSSMVKYYEELKSRFNETKNIIFINETGVWIIDRTDRDKNIIRIEKIDNNFSSFNQITIYNFDLDNNFVQRIDAKDGILINNTWRLNKVNIISSNNKKIKENSFNNYTLKSNINVEEIKNIYKNTESTSLFEINKKISILEDKGYSAIDLKIRFQKLLSFPLYLLSMSILSGVMIINLGKTSNYIKCGIYGVLISTILYFLNDLSITMAKSDIISVDFSVWIPIFLIILTNMVGIIQVNAK